MGNNNKDKMYIWFKYIEEMKIYREWTEEI